MIILIALFGGMVIISMVVILSAMLVAARSDRQWNEWKDLEEFERSLQEQPPQQPKSSSSNGDGKNSNVNNGDMNTYPNK